MSEIENNPDLLLPADGSHDPEIAPASLSNVSDESTGPKLYTRKKRKMTTLQTVDEGVVDEEPIAADIAAVEEETSNPNPSRKRKVGIIIRALRVGHIPQASFILVTMGSTAVLLIGWRALLFNTFFKIGSSKKNDIYKQGNPFELFELLTSLIRRW